MEYEQRRVCRSGWLGLFAAEFLPTDEPDGCCGDEIHEPDGQSDGERQRNREEHNTQCTYDQPAADDREHHLFIGEFGRSWIGGWNRHGREWGIVSGNAWEGDSESGSFLAGGDESDITMMTEQNPPGDG